MKSQASRFPLLLVVVLLLPLVLTVVKAADNGIRWLDGASHGAILSHRLLSTTLDRARGYIDQLGGSQLVNAPLENLPDFAWQDLFDGKLQKTVEILLNGDLPLRPNVVRLVNQMYFDWFDKSYMHSSSLIVGKDRQLFELSYVSDYCSRHRSNAASFALWANELKELATFFKERGQVFVYLITPSKAAYFPEFIPAQFKCEILPANSDYALATAALRDSGIPFFDAAAIIRQAKGTLDVELFPRGGTHWNYLGAGMATRELINTINLQRDGLLPVLEFTHYIDRQPSETDADLAELANLWRSDVNYPSPHLKIVAHRENLQKRPTLALVGGSFLNQILEILDESQYFDRIDYFNYFTEYRRSYPTRQVSPVNANEPESYRALLDADIVVIEENQSLIDALHSQHVKLLMTALLSSGNQKMPVHAQDAGSTNRE